jgi:ABC-type transport system involved in multi-copper enzyme maturation permease subunit
VKAVLAVALDLFREASSRRWFLALGIGITLLLAIAGLTLRIDVVDGALSATRLFGKVLHSDIRSVDVALRPVFRAAAYVIFYGGLAFGVLACADFAPSLLAPGRIEHLLALPVQRWQLLAGTFFGVLALSMIGALYGAGGFTLLLAVKTGVWTLRPLLAALLASVTFAAIYGGMLVAALFARSAALSAATGGFLFLTGIVAGYRGRLEHFFEPGLGRTAFKAVTLLLPRVSTLADASADLAASAPVDRAALGSELFGLAVFGLAALAFGIWRFESQDF